MVSMERNNNTPNQPERSDIIPPSEYLEDRSAENIELLEQHPNTSYLAPVYDKLIEEYPMLKSVKFIHVDTDHGMGTRFSYIGEAPRDNSERGYTGIPELQYDFDKAPGSFTVSDIPEGSPRTLEEDDKRNKSVIFERFANALGVPISELCKNQKLTSTIVFLHELGHAHDFIANFLAADGYDLAYGGVSPERFEAARAAWRERNIADMKAYPLPKTNEQVTARNKSFEERKKILFDDFLKFRTKLNEAGIDTSGLDRGYFYDVDLQLARRYRDGEAEKYADDFAVDFVTKHPELFGEN